MTGTRAVLGVAAAVAVLVSGATVSRADAPGPLVALVDAAAQRLQTADAVAAAKWTAGGAIEDPARERQVLDAVTATARERGADPGYVERIFRDQIDATVAVEYALFSDWKFEPAGAPVTAPNLADSRVAIDGFNQTMVNEIVVQSDSLRSPSCADDLRAARDAVVAARGLDDLYQRGLASATRSYCR
jgi:chorismate mutase